MGEGLVLTRQRSERGVHDWAQRGSAGPAGQIVRHYVGYEEWTNAPFVRRETARCGAALIFGFGDPLDVYENGDETCTSSRRLRAFVIGNQTAFSLTGVGGHQLGVQIELTPAGALHLFGDALQELSDAAVPLGEVLGTPAERLVERVADAATWDARLDALDAALSPSDSVPNLSPEVLWLQRQLTSSHGHARVEQLMDQTGWSRRHVSQRFRRQLGVSPKAYARLLRFERATSLLSRPDHRRTLADIATEAGYYDQSHFTRDFTALTGSTPGAYVADLSVGPEVRFVQDNGPVASAE